MISSTLAAQSANIYAVLSQWFCRYNFSEVAPHTIGTYFTSEIHELIFSDKFINLNQIYFEQC